ncbi:hypothetical protein GCM10010345_60890 [Streptomyces canarius]|uniref:Uncharacterized protein n=1 Tax=Streptomyces canarius TaxID=285453 RepID=A0ABQ3D2J9_9ACTN|nr:hypothetical protein GCM10010345_60890 [Streptomyces canarius]
MADSETHRTDKGRAGVVSAQLSRAASAATAGITAKASRVCRMSAARSCRRLPPDPTWSQSWEPPPSTASSAPVV